MTAIMQQLQDARICHRDIKQGNVLMDARGGLQLIDFGLCEQLGAPVHTQTGTPHAMAPEVLLAQAPPDCKLASPGPDW
jgi:serine/threonine protein kinase